MFLYFTLYHNQLKPKKKTIATIKSHQRIQSDEPKGYTSEWISFEPREDCNKRGFAMLILFLLRLCASAVH